MRKPRIRRRVSIALVSLALLGILSCEGPESKAPAEAAAPSRPDELFRVGSVAVYQADLDRWLQERYRNRQPEQVRQAALDDLVGRARFVQAALDAGLADDPLTRDEISRLLAARLRETELAPQLKKQLVIPEARLREIYDADRTRFQAPEKRQVAVLWLDSGPDPEAKRYAAKLEQAREFVLQNRDILDHPEKGFSILGADYSEHSASRFRGGIVGWMEAGGGLDSWTKAVAKIAFTIGEKGGLSEVVTHPEGVFLVRLVDLKPALTRSFESVASQLERAERTRLRGELEASFEKSIEDRYPVEWSN